MIVIKNEVSQEHGHGYYLFECDKCDHLIAIDVADVFTSNFKFHCPICGANRSHLTYKELRT